MEKLSAFFFDLGNVIVKFDVKRVEKGYEPFGYKRAGDLSRFIMESDTGRKYMQGKITSSQFYSRTCRYYRMKMKFGEFYRIWNSMFYPYPRMERVIRDISEKYPDIPLVMVSDTNESHFNFLMKEYDVLELMDHYVLSHKVGKLKPHPDMYKEALRVSGALAKNVFYADDRPELIKAARVMGLRAYHFTGYESLAEQLSKFGIEV